MKITAITKKSGTRYTVEVDGAYWNIVDEEIIASAQLRVGLEVDEAFLQEVRLRAEERRARERAYHLLERRDYAEKELYDKLCTSVSRETAAKTVAKMLDLGLIDDERYARKWAEYLLQTKHFSRRRAYYELQRRGIDRELAQAALEEQDISANEQLAAIITQKYRRKLAEPNGTQKVIAALARQGFSYSDIRRALSAWEQEEEDSWQFE